MFGFLTVLALSAGSRLSFGSTAALVAARARARGRGGMHCLLPSERFVSPASFVQVELEVVGVARRCRDNGHRPWIRPLLPNNAKVRGTGQWLLRRCFLVEMAAKESEERNAIEKQLADAIKAADCNKSFTVLRFSLPFCSALSSVQSARDTTTRSPSAVVANGQTTLDRLCALPQPSMVRSLQNSGF